MFIKRNRRRSSDAECTSVLLVQGERVSEKRPPWTPLKKPLAQCKVALMSSGGVLYRDQPRFHREDTSYRLIPKNAQRDELSVWHFGYPTGDAERDPNQLGEEDGDGDDFDVADPQLEDRPAKREQRREDVLNT